MEKRFISVPSLSLPQEVEDLRDVGNLTHDLMRYEATRLFTERAIKANPQFTLTKENAPAVTQICKRLDGIPLAIELAAARAQIVHASTNCGTARRPLQTADRREPHCVAAPANPAGFDRLELSHS